MRTMSRPFPSPTVVVYARSGCHLCEVSIAALDAILSERPSDKARPTVEIVDIESDETLLRRYLETIPVLRVGEAELPLALSAGAIRGFLAETLGFPPA